MKEMQTLKIFWSNWRWNLSPASVNKIPPSCPLLVPSKVGQIRLLIRKSLWVLPACHVIVYSKVVHLEIWIGWPTYLCLALVLIHVALSLLLVLSCWQLEQFIEQHSLIPRSVFHLEVFLKKFEIKTKFLERFSWIAQCVWLLSKVNFAFFFFPTKNKVFVGLKVW